MADLDPLVKQTLERVRPGRHEHDQRLKRYDHSYDIWRGTRPRQSVREPWQSDLRPKYGMQVIDTALVNVVSGLPRVVVRPRRPQDEVAAKAMQAVLDYHVGEDHFVEKQPTFVQQGLIYGVTCAKVHWLYQTQQKTGRQWIPHPYNPGEFTPQMGVQEIIVRDGPTFEPWDIYRCFWDPNARDVDTAGYVVLQTYVSPDDAKSNQCTVDHKKNPDAPCNGIYHNVDQWLQAGQAKQPNQSAQNRVVGASSQRTKDMLLLEEVWTGNALLGIGNQQVLVRAQENPYWHGRKPIVVAQPRPDLFELQGIAETELVDDLQQGLWTVKNMRFDNWHLTVMRGLTYREGGVTDPNALQLRPRFKWAVTDHDDVKPFEVQPLPPEAYREEESLLGSLQLVTGINPYVSGSDLSTVDQNTATGVTALQDVASRLLRFKAAQIQYKGYQRTFEMWGDMVQQFMDQELFVKIAGPGGQDAWARVSPQDVVGHFHYVLQGSEESLSRQQERGEAIALLNAFAPLAATGMVNFGPILEKVAAAYDFPNPEALLNQPQPQAPAAPMMPGQMQQQAPQANPLMGGQSLNPAIAQAITRRTVR